MKNIYIGDIHGRSIWKEIVAAHPDADNIVFIGDYFDSYDDISTDDQIENLKNILEFKKSFKGQVHLLIGNHDHHYLPSVGYTGTSGYQSFRANDIGELFNTNMDSFSMSVLIGNVLCSHAGISPIFLKNNGWVENDDIVSFLNDLLRYKPRKLIFNGSDFYGDDIYQTPIWIRPKSFMLSNYLDTCIAEKYIQIVGHTNQDTINISSCGRFYFIDTLPLGEYLVEIDNSFNVQKVQ
jgi:hypothetical protein